MSRYRVYGYREQLIEAVVDAESKEEAEELVFTAHTDGTRPEGLIDFFEDGNEWAFDVAQATVSERDHAD